MDDLIELVGYYQTLNMNYKYQEWVYTVGSADMYHVTAHVAHSKLQT